MSSENAYKVVVKNKNRYYCSKVEYDRHIEDKKFHEHVRQEIEYILSNILDMPLYNNAIIYKEWKDWKCIASNEVILDFLRSKEKYLINKIDKIQASFSKIKYLSAVIKNSIKEDEI